MIDPGLPASIRALAPAFATRQTPSRLVFITARQSSSVIRVNQSSREMPELLMMMSQGLPSVS